MDDVFDVRGIARSIGMEPRWCKETPIDVAGGPPCASSGIVGGSSGEPTGEVLALWKPSWRWER